MMCTCSIKTVQGICCGCGCGPRGCQFSYSSPRSGPVGAPPPCRQEDRGQRTEDRGGRRSGQAAAPPPCPRWTEDRGRRTGEDRGQSGQKRTEDGGQERTEDMTRGQRTGEDRGRRSAPTAAGPPCRRWRWRGLVRGRPFSTRIPIRPFGGS
jgi:hypothetical protein